MKHIPYLYIGAFTFLIACSSEERITTDSNEDPSGPIELSAGIAEGNSKATTRTGAEDHHTTPGHQTFTAGTKIALRINGRWEGHTPSEIVETTTASLNGVAQDTDDKHNKLSCSPVLYWEDYGTSDINNIGTGKGREEGLTIYGAAVDGVTSVPSGLISSGSTIDGTIGKWTSLGWTLDANQSSGFSEKDLLISNNISGDNGATYQYDYGRYLFDKHTLGKLLEFKHALSKITVVLTAGAGFTGGNFATAPEVKLTSNDASTSNPEWACTKGNVNIITGGVTLTGTSGDPSVITMWQASSTGHVVTKEALVMPGSQFTGDDAIIARINADGNIYYVTAANIRAAIILENSSNTDYKTEAGKNYIINVTVNQTDVSVRVTATVANWTDVSAAEVAPVINVNANYGGGSTAFSKDEYSLFRSTSLAVGYGTADGDYFKEERRVRKVDENWIMSEYVTSAWQASPLYWPNHITHYQFRGVWPAAGSETGTIETGVVSYPRLESSSHSGTPQVIKVSNVAYTANSFPSDLMIARPEIDPSTLCTNKDHTNVSLYNVGICATEGTINLNFRYMMSQVEVNLSTKDNPSDPDYVNLANAKVEIVNVYNTGDVKLGEREVVPTGSTDSYTLNPVAGGGNENKRWSAIVPQTLTYTSPLHADNVMFRITIYNNGDTNSIDDIYYADIEPIQNSAGTAKVAPNGAWESGVRYVYNLRLTKTGVKVTATLTDWAPVTASQTVWF
jgi:hypothetical protein